MEGYWWHFNQISRDGKCRLSHGDKREIVVGEKLTVNGPPRLCQWGLHASLRLKDAADYSYVMNSCLHLVKLSGQIINDIDKDVATERTVIAQLTPIELVIPLKKFAKKMAMKVSHLWKPSENVIGWMTEPQETRSAIMREIGEMRHVEISLERTAFKMAEKGDYSKIKEYYAIKTFLKSMDYSNDELITWPAQYASKALHYEKMANGNSDIHETPSQILYELHLELEDDVIQAMRSKGYNIP